MASLTFKFDDPAIDASFRAFRPTYIVVGETPDGSLSLTTANDERQAHRIAVIMKVTRPDPRCTVTIYRVAGCVRPDWRH